MIEHFFTCPYCWERISMLLDPDMSGEEYVEDCEVCCRPIVINQVSNDGFVESFSHLAIEGNS
ncbi:MAG: CPXCG motif-containing cysteine-rich protein [Campylobacteraceae bacterium]|jgi:hypothetical protein|nr:CPXCG motif-containing cysteine-rich protein [Campylobacteraceae bacterium]MBT3882722.1 CPXCG motif-containing cysteine-rich protein [Campylobacteraceae bacterium]MBT4030502.1 CPXCG motif-containing cysteine-rich protein [Campylobacteraceae bacterium]MBT4179439.1 CPXCG motif-containing cysteine-rich protein [Campylobacteraceae bacterium]MBT4572922.1 CPXCG motif-containing cysteine-rich protein [Campylobacteraceae bacterium]